MKREDFLALLSVLLLLEGYLAGNLVPASLGFFTAFYLMAIRSGVRLNVEASREVSSDKLEEGKPFEVKIALKNRGDSAVVRISQGIEGFEVKTPRELLLPPGGEREVPYTLIPLRTGDFTIGPTELIITDERGLYTELVEAGESFKVSVYPSVDSIKEAAKADYNLRLAEAYRKSQFAGTEGLDIKELREFQHGDDFKRIDWKASMRLGELIVREMMREQEADVYIFIDNTSEMRKGIRRAKVDYAASLALQLAAVLLKDYRVGMVIYDETSADIVRAGRGKTQLELLRRKLNLRWKEGEMSLKFSLSVRVSEKARAFLASVLPLKKGRRGGRGLFEGLSLIKNPSFLIFISDLSNPSELYRAIARAKAYHRVILLSPNPVLFYSGELDGETLKRLYRAYIERENVLKKFRALVPTIDLGPSDYVRELARVV